jgi:hypothetical protein
VRPSAVVRRAAEIAASDEDDGLGSSSEDELEDLMAKFDPRRKASTNSGARGQQPSLLETPRAKRTMVSSAHSSPLTINTKPKFDLKALALDALEDEAAYAGALKVKKATEERNAAAISAAKRREGPSGTFMDMVQGKTGHDAQKVLRAVQRAESDQPRPRYCFWNPDFVAPNPSPPPKAVRSGPWRLLTEGTTQARERTLTSGLPLTLVQKRGMLPDELFCWILGELCVQRSVLMQDEYRNIICSCPEQVGRLLTADRLESLFMLQGADEDLGSWEDELKISIISEEPYKDKDWLQLRSLLQLLARIAENMSASAVTYAVQVLLRMSLDEFLILNIDVLMDYERAIASLIDAIPLSDWDSFVSHSMPYTPETQKTDCSSVTIQVHSYIKQPQHRASGSTRSCVCPSVVRVHTSSAEEWLWRCSQTTRPSAATTRTTSSPSAASSTDLAAMTLSCGRRPISWSSVRALPC